MKTRQWLFVAVLPLWFGCKTSEPPRPPTVAATPIVASNLAPYLRVARPTTNLTELQVAVREFVPSSRAQPVIWLAGVSHVGESNYYVRLQKLLDAQDLVLYEGVTDRASRVAKRPPVEPPSEDELGSLQTTMAESLGLAFQLTSIDYERKHFRNSDLTIEEIAQLIAKEGPAGKPSKTAQEFQKLMEMMQGDSLIGVLVGGVLKLIGSSPKLQAMMKLAMIEMLGRFKGDLSQFEGLPPEWQRLMQILLHARNEAVLKDLQAELARRSPAKSIAIFYGAAHMEDLQQRLIERFSYRPSRELWLPAFSVDLQKTQITPAELSFVQTIVDWQMQLLEQKGDE